MSKPRIPRKAKKTAKKHSQQFGWNGYDIPVQTLIWVPVADRYVIAKIAEVKK